MAMHMLTVDGQFDNNMFVIQPQAGTQSLVEDAAGVPVGEINSQPHCVACPVIWVDD